MTVDCGMFMGLRHIHGGDDHLNLNSILGTITD